MQRVGEVVSAPVRWRVLCRVSGPQLWVASRVAEGQLDRLPVFGLHGCRIFKDVEDVVCGESLLEVVQGKVEGVEVDAPWSRKPKGVCLWS